MIGKDEIAESIRNADAIAEEHENLPAYWHKRGVDLEGLTYVAMQRGLRAVMLQKGVNPNVPRGYSVRLTADEQRQQMAFAASFMDGFAAAYNLNPTDLEPE